ncbi:MAG: hypothetical protein KAS93_06925 [Gammaproteobacteria bacterium]|nr:hypothetical protein [Gammaproteobacteria bacterium]
MLPKQDIFSYSQIMTDPKSQRPDRLVNGVSYHVLHNNGWLRLATNEGRFYHTQQAAHLYLLPDWKLHMSVANESLPTAWNVVADIFMRYGCNTTMKMTVEDYGNNAWSENMFGREITVYIYRHKKYYETAELILDDNHNFCLTRAFQKNRAFWLQLVSTLDLELSEQGVQSRGCNPGDKRIGRYVSLRNESYVPLRPLWRDNGIIPDAHIKRFEGKDFCYPPNIAGYNAAGNIDPLMTYSNRLFAMRSSPQQKTKRQQVRRLINTSSDIIHL